VGMEAGRELPPDPLAPPPTKRPTKSPRRCLTDAVIMGVQCVVLAAWLSTTSTLSPWWHGSTVLLIIFSAGVGAWNARLYLAARKSAKTTSG